MNKLLIHKIDQSIRLLSSIPQDKTIELCYSGGKDSDIILELARMSAIPFVPIYKNTTIDPPGTLHHVADKGVFIVHPKHTFRELILHHGYPTRMRRFCCSNLKEYKIHDQQILGIRRYESPKRSRLYVEPTRCRFFGSKKNRVSQFFPILEWTNEDLHEFIVDRGIRLHPLYYLPTGDVDCSRRLGCIGCPLKADAGLGDFKRYPRFVRMWTRAASEWWATHELKYSKARFRDVYELFVHNVFFHRTFDFQMAISGLFGRIDCKNFLQSYFNIKL